MDHFDELIRQQEIKAEVERLKEDFRCPFEESLLGMESVAAELLAILGTEKFRVLQQRFGGQRIWIPKPGGPVLCKQCPERDEHIRELHRLGKPVAWIAEKFGLSNKRVYGIIEQGK